MKAWCDLSFAPSSALFETEISLLLGLLYRTRGSDVVHKINFGAPGRDPPDSPLAAVPANIPTSGAGAALLDQALRADRPPNRRRSPAGSAGCRQSRHTLQPGACSRRAIPDSWADAASPSRPLARRRPAMTRRPRPVSRTVAASETRTKTRRVSVMPGHRPEPSGGCFATHTGQLTRRHSWPGLAAPLDQLRRLLAEVDRELAAIPGGDRLGAHCRPLQCNSWTRRRGPLTAESVAR
jgi:hypothetical protein